MAENKNKTPNIKSEAGEEWDVPILDLGDEPKTEEKSNNEDFHFESKDIHKKDMGELFVNVSDAEKIAHTTEQKRIKEEKALTKKMVSTYRERMKGHKKTARNEKRAESKEKINQYIKKNRPKFKIIRNSLIALAIVATVIFLGIKIGSDIVTDINNKNEAAMAAKKKEERLKEHSESIEAYKDDYLTIKALAYKYAEYSVPDAVLYLQAAIDKYNDSDNNTAKACLHATRAAIVYNDHVFKKIHFTDEEKSMILSDAKAAYKYEPTRQMARLAREYAMGLGDEQLAEEYNQKYEEAKE